LQAPSTVVADQLSPLPLHILLLFAALLPLLLLHPLPLLFQLRQQITLILKLFLLRDALSPGRLPAANTACPTPAPQQAPARPTHALRTPLCCRCCRRHRLLPLSSSPLPPTEHCRARSPACCQRPERPVLLLLHLLLPPAAGPCIRPKIAVQPAKAA
jgi:hypothetical protein